jgi:hypothetical protein
LEVNVPPESSDCFQRFGYTDFKDFEVDPGKLRPPACPVRACSTKPVTISCGKIERAFCPAHGIRLHANTLVYWNGEEKKDEARLRNFCIRPDLAREIALHSVGKAESYRLGYEMSEDALTWNVFVGLAQARKLRCAIKFLTDRDVDAEPSLYLWGRLVDVTGSESKAEYFLPLREVRDQLERGIRNFRTEPDVMMVLDRQLLICIEAKFGSGNTLAYEGQVRDGDKPTDRVGLLQRYLDEEKGPEEARRIIDRNSIGATFHGQLFRNIVFASAMAKRCDWHVVNLVRTTQWKSRSNAKRCSFANPEESVRSYLRQSFQDCFSFRTWEELHRALIKDEAELCQLNTYLCTKSAHYRRAFDLD